MADIATHPAMTPEHRHTPLENPSPAGYEPGVPRHIEYPRQALPTLLRIAARRYPRRAATVFQGARVSYRELHRLADACAAGLRAAGVRPGDRVALVLPNLPQFPIAFYGALRAGAVVVACNPLYTAHELAYQLADSGAETVIALDRFVPVVQHAMTVAVEAGTPTTVRRIYSADVAPFLPPALRIAYRLKGIRSPQRHRGTEAQRFEGMLKEYRGRRCEGVARAPEDLAVLQYTGGTTGRAKGAMLTHGNLLANAIQTWSWSKEGRRGAEVNLCVAPFFHIYGLTVGLNLSVYAGATMVLVPRFQIEEVVKAIRRYRPTMWPAVPTMYAAVAKLAERGTLDCKSLRICISGGAPLPLEVQQRFERLTGGSLVEGYGLSEAGPVTHCNPVRGVRVPGSIGLPFPDTEARLDPDALPGNTDPKLGELLVCGPQVMAGYWNRPEDTAAVLQEGWLRTGDIARVDADGYYYIVDRAKDVIIAGGFNIYPREVEEVLYAHPAVQEAVVVGVPDEYRGETVKAFIVPGNADGKDGADDADRAGVAQGVFSGVSADGHGIGDMRAMEESILAHCRARLAPYKVPKQIEFREALPTSAVGKLLRRALREEHLAHSLQPSMEGRR
jgi:long-chain acyl-CoA synthetase